MKTFRIQAGHANPRVYLEEHESGNLYRKFEVDDLVQRLRSRIQLLKSAWEVAIDQAAELLAEDEETEEVQAAAVLEIFETAYREGEACNL